MIDGVFGIFFETVGIMTVLFFVVWGIVLGYDALKNNNTKDCDDDSVYCVEEDLHSFKKEMWEYMDSLECRLDILEEDINAALATKVSKKKSR